MTAMFFPSHDIHAVIFLFDLNFPFLQINISNETPQQKYNMGIETTQ